MPTTQIYIRKGNWEQFNQESNKSDLINSLLSKHYNGRVDSEFDHLPDATIVNVLEAGRQADKEATAYHKSALNIPGVVKGSDFVPKEKDPFKQFLKDYSQPGTRPPHPEYGYPCCHKASPCRHWAYDEVESHWVNELTKETKDA